MPQIEEKKQEDSAPPESQENLTFSSKTITSEMSTKECYFEQLRAWVNTANLSQKVSANFPYYLMANYPQLFNSQTTFGDEQQAANRPNPNPEVNGYDFRRDRFEDVVNNPARQEAIIRQNGGFEFVIAPFWKRVIAEIVDIAILMLIKLMITFTIIDLFDLDLSIDFNLDSLKKSLEDDYTEFLSFSTDLLIFEIVTKITVCFYEAVWTMFGITSVGGATPGKILLGLRIVYVEAIHIIQPQPPQHLINFNNARQPVRALLFPAQNTGFKRALLRAVVKNFIITLLFPMCFIVLLFKNNRTAYDVLSKTVVVEENQMPVFRRLLN